MRENRERAERKERGMEAKDMKKIPTKKYPYIPQSQVVIYYQSNDNKKNLKENATEVSKKRQVVIANTATESYMIYFEQITLYSHIIFFLLQQNVLL